MDITEVTTETKVNRAQDMAPALGNGELWLVFRENEDREARAAVAFLSPDGPCKGPVTVTGWVERRGLGAWDVLPEVGVGFFGRTETGPGGRFMAMSTVPAHPGGSQRADVVSGDDRKRT